MRLSQLKAPSFSVRMSLWLWLLAEISIIYLITNQIIWVVIVFFMGPLIAIGALSIVSGFIINPIKLNLKSFLMMWFGEWLSFMVLFRGLQLLPKRCHVKSNEVAHRHVIFVHGFFCNAGMWAPLARKCEQLQFSTSFVEMTQLTGSLEMLADELQVEVKRLKDKHPNTEVSVVAFSMGGLAARACLLRFEHIPFRLITVHSPHKGTHLAWFFALLGAKNAQQMVPGSKWLTQLESKDAARGYPFNVLWSKHDTIVMPAKLADYGLSKDEEEGKGHLFAAIDPDCHQIIVETLLTGSTY